MVYIHSWQIQNYEKKCEAELSVDLQVTWQMLYIFTVPSSCILISLFNQKTKEGGHS